MNRDDGQKQVEEASDANGSAGAVSKEQDQAVENEEGVEANECEVDLASGVEVRPGRRRVSFLTVGDRHCWQRW